MSSRTVKTIYHLSPDGWVPGTEPADRVETWRRKVSSGDRVSWRRDCADLQKSNAERDALRKQFHAFKA